MPWGVQAAMSVLVRGMETFVTVTPDQFLFGYDDTLVTLANIANTLLHINWPAPRIMSLLKGVRVRLRNNIPAVTDHISYIFIAEMLTVPQFLHRPLSKFL